MGSVVCNLSLLTRVSRIDPCTSRVAHSAGNYPDGGTVPYVASYTLVSRCLRSMGVEQNKRLITLDARFRSWEYNNVRRRSGYRVESDSIFDVNSRSICGWMPELR
jgi:hypothetical protein